MCSDELFVLAFSTASKRTLFLKNSPFSIVRVILISSWSTILPAPMFICPTSELPICPSGKPTALPLASISVYGHVSKSLVRFGVFAIFTALPSVSSVMPKPSIIISIVKSFFMLFLSINNLQPLKNLQP